MATIYADCNGSEKNAGASEIVALSFRTDVIFQRGPFLLGDDVFFFPGLLIASLVGGGA